jgi:formylmethanofuran dehydrogenase subunit E
MNIGKYTFDEYVIMAAAFHGNPAPGLLIGGFMVELAKGALPEGTIFDAVVETPKCLPDAVQLLTLCSYGNGWMKIVNLGRYALALYDKYTGEGVRVWIDPAKLTMWPEIRAWFLKLKPKREQNRERLVDEIRRAGPGICGMAPVTVAGSFLKKGGMGAIAVCPLCGEAYPAADGGMCRGCSGEHPYVTDAGTDRDLTAPSGPALRAIPAAQAVGRRALHDMTRIVPGESKDPEFLAGQLLTAGDVCRLHTMGRERVFVMDDVDPGLEWVHENEAALAFARAMAGEGVTFEEPPKEGKINFRAEREGLLLLDRQRLKAFNLVENVMCASRQGFLPVEGGKRFAACRAIPLYLGRALFDRAMAVLEDGPMFSIAPIKPLPTGILVTGTEVFKGLVQDKFIPIVKSKVEKFGCQISGTAVVPDDMEAIARAASDLVADGAELLVTTAGLSVDPDDVTRKGLIQAGLTQPLYGTPVLPGAMTLVGRMGKARVLGVPACALYYQITALDLLLPRLLAGLDITRADLADMAEGGFCLTCKTCTFPKCPFGK